MYAPSSDRDYGFDFLRGIAILFVLIVHSFAGFESTSGPGFVVGWLLTITRPCIAIFLFASGYFFRPDANLLYLTTRLKRLLVPYLIFSVLALLYQTRVIHLPGLLLSQPGQVLGNLLIGNTWGVYWFIPAILVAYLLGFALLRGDPRRVIWLTLFFLAINLLHAAYYDAIIARFHLQNNGVVWLYSYRFFITWPFYFFLGALFRRYNLREFLMQNRGKVVALWAMVFAVYNFLYWTGIVPTGGYNSIVDTLESVTAIGALMVVAANVPALNFLGRYSYPIYLSHYFFIAFANFAVTSLLGQRALWFPLAVLLFSLAGSVLLIWLSQRLLGRRARILLAA